MTYPRISRHTGFTPREATLALVDWVARTHSVTLEDVMSRSRERAIAVARQEVFWRLYMGGKSSIQIGRMFGRDHTTVLHGIRRAEVRHGAA
jgi:chromosomal replication initiation ATPase DnaA